MGDSKGSPKLKFSKHSHVILSSESIFDADFGF